MTDPQEFDAILASLTEASQELAYGREFNRPFQGWLPAQSWDSLAEAHEDFLRATDMLREYLQDTHTLLLAAVTAIYYILRHMKPSDDKELAERVLKGLTERLKELAGTV